jgi:hypothetical protein
MSSVGLGPGSDSELYQYITDPSSRQGRRPTTWRLQTSDSNKNLFVGPRRRPDTKTDWPTDRRSQNNLNLNLNAWGITGNLKN